MKLPRTAAALALALALLAGCGSNSDSDTAAAPDAHEAGAHEPEPEPTAIEGSSIPKSTSARPHKATPKPVVKTSTAAGTTTPAGAAAATAAKLAEAGVLRPADMPGFTVTTRQPQDVAAAEKGLYTCLRTPRPGYVSRDPGNVWSKGTLQVTSAGDVLKSAAAAKQGLAAAQSARGPKCFAEFLLAGLVRPASDTTAVAEKVPVSVPGADGAFAVRLELTVTDANGPTTFTGYLVGAVVGAVQISVWSLVKNGPGQTLKDIAGLADVAADRVRAALRTT